MTTKTKPRAKRLAEQDPSSGIVHWKCTTCDFEWTAHGAIKSCPKCRSPKIESATLDDAKPRGRAWKCAECEEISWQAGFATVCGNEECASKDIFPLDHARQCTACYEWYEATELSCPECGNQEFSLEPIFRDDALDQAFDAEAKAPPAANGQLTTSATVLEVPIDQVYASPDNPRKTFDEAHIDELAKSIAKVGILQRLLVRSPGLQGYELIAGECRLRAARKAKLKTVPIEVREVSARQAVLMRLEENFRRRDLNPIDQAKAFSDATTSGGYTQQELADSLHLTQGAIANKIRLLKLPEAWQARIISGEITEKFARDKLLAWAEVPGVLEGAAKEFGKKLNAEPDYVEEVVREVCWEKSRSMATDAWRTERVKFKPTPEQTKALDIRKVERENRAFNTKLYDELQAAAEARGEKRQAAQAAKEKKLSPAEQKAKAKKLADQFAKRLYGWKIRWLQKKLAERIVDEGMTELPLLKLLMHFAVTESHSARLKELGDAVLAAGGAKKQTGDYYKHVNALRSLATVPGEKLWDVAAVALGKWVLHDTSSFHCDLQPKEIEALADELEIDLKKEWTLDESFLELHTAAQLAELMEEWDMAAEVGATRKATIKLILVHRDAAKKPPACPRELLSVKPVRLT